MSTYTNTFNYPLVKELSVIDEEWSIKGNTLLIYAEDYNLAKKIADILRVSVTLRFTNDDTKTYMDFVIKSEDCYYQWLDTFYYKSAPFINYVTKDWVFILSEKDIVILNSCKD